MSDFVPIPVGWRIIVEPMHGKKESEAGIDLSASMDAQEHLQYIGKVVAVGEAAFSATTKGGINMSEWTKKPQKGDYVIYPPYGGVRIRRTEKDGKERPILIAMNDTDIIAIIDDPTKYYSWVDA